MSNAAAVSFEGVWKRFPAHRAGARTLHGLLARPSAALRRNATFWALQNVNVNVGRGETLGIIGANGAGKSTFLRLAGGVGRPSRGRVLRRGAVGPMLTLGESFDPLLTGRENAVTAAIVAGYTKREALERLPAMAAFAELEDSLDEPLRTYSAGMTLRLSFAVAISSEPDVLLVDEVLAVGDLRFQRKCLNRIRELQEGGTAILLASHDEGQIRSTCQRVLWLDRGAVRALGEPDEAYGLYRNALRAADEPVAPAVLGTPRISASGDLRHGENRFGTLATEIVDVRIDPDVAVPATATVASPIRIELDLLPHTPLENPIVGISLWRVRDGAKVLDVSTAGDGVDLGLIDRATTVAVELDRIDAEPGRYRLDVGLYEAGWRSTYDYHWQAYTLEVAQRGGATFGPPRRWAIA